MFESAELDHEVSKALYRREEPKLRQRLLDAQYDLKENGSFPVLILIAGVEGAGKGETVNLLNEWMDPRHVLTHGFAEPSDEEQRAAAPVALLEGAAAEGQGRRVLRRLAHRSDRAARVRQDRRRANSARRSTRSCAWRRCCATRACCFSSTGSTSRARQQKKRLKAAGEDYALSRTSKFLKVMRELRAPHLDRARRRGSSSRAPTTATARSPSAGTCSPRCASGSTRSRSARLPDRQPPLARPADNLNIIRALELDQPLDKTAYRKEFKKLQARLGTLSRDKRFKRSPRSLVFEGNDAAGKGGAIRRVTSALDARYYRTVPVAAPTEEERAQPYLWRFWRHLPRARPLHVLRPLLVRPRAGRARRALRRRSRLAARLRRDQRVRALAGAPRAWWWSSSGWRSARTSSTGASSAREKIAFKRFKITADDWRNRKKWDAYEEAVCDMVDRTSTSVAPWTLVEANNKYYARLKVLKTVCDALEAALDRVK